ncbi:MAG: hypothetical protein ACYCW6_05115, partial [Candidatus Xenobia bacterium]
KPLFNSVSETTRPVEVHLSGPQFGAFNGAVVETPVDAADALEKDAEVTLRVRANLQRLIDAGRIKMTTPDQKLKASDYFDKDGQPYAGIVRWEDGRMRIERVKIAT